VNVITLSAILSKNCVCILNGYRDSAISLYRRATRHVLTRAAKCIDVESGISESVLY
jgi:hypothetical protein